MRGKELLLLMAISLALARVSVGNGDPDSICHDAATDLKMCSSAWRAEMDEIAPCCSLLDAFYENGCFCPDCLGPAKGLVSEAGSKLLGDVYHLVESCQGIGESASKLMDMVVLLGQKEHGEATIGVAISSSHREVVPLREQHTENASAEQQRADLATVDVRLQGTVSQVKVVLAFLESASKKGATVLSQREEGAAVSALVTAALHSSSEDRPRQTSNDKESDAESCACMRPDSWPRGLPAPLQSVRDALCRFFCAHRSALEAALIVEILVAACLILYWAMLKRWGEGEFDKDADACRASLGRQFIIQDQSEAHQRFMA